MTERQDAVAKTLRYVASVSDEAQARWMYDLAEEVENSKPSDWWACPVCEEVICDEGCPLEPLRRDA